MQQPTILWPRHGACFLGQPWSTVGVPLQYVYGLTSSSIRSTHSLHMATRALKKTTRDKVLPVGLSAAELREVQEEASVHGLTPTQVARAAILRYIREERARRKSFAEPRRAAS